MNSKRPPFTVTESEGEGGRGRGFRGGGHLISEFKTLAHMSITPDSYVDNLTRHFHWRTEGLQVRS